MKKQISISPEWVFSQFDTICWADGDGNARISSQSKANANLMSLTLDSLEISYKKEYFSDNHFNSYSRFIFRIEAIMNDCPDLYQLLVTTNNIMKETKIN